MESAFDEAYSHWPKKVERKKALEQFKVAAKKKSLPELVETIVTFGEAYAATTTKQFTPALGVWLSHERWDDELPSAPEPSRASTPTTKADQNAALSQQLYGGDHERTRGFPALDPGLSA
jgi:hypothetical protein